MTEHHPQTDDRAEQAVRGALSIEELPALPAPGVIRARVRDRRLLATAVIGCLVLAVLAGGMIALERQETPGVVIASAAGRLPADPAPDGWRTEYYRDISFEVPSTWGYAYAADLRCASSSSARRQRPYVSLGRPSVDFQVGCRSRESIPVQHAEVSAIPPGGDYAPLMKRSADGWWYDGRILGHVLLGVVSRDDATTRRIVESVQLSPSDAPCEPRHPLAQNEPARPMPFDLTATADVGAMVVCQYAASGVEPDRGLEAVARLDARSAQTAVAAIRDSPVLTPEPCEQPTTRGIALVMRFEADGRVRELYLQAGSCRGRVGAYGGFDDGLDVRALTRAACHAVLVLPVQLTSSDGSYVGHACLG